MFKRITRFIALLIAAAMLAGTAALAAATRDDAVTEAAAWLKENGLYAGDNTGSLNLDKSLTRAELAVILTRLDILGYGGDLEEELQYYSDGESREEVRKWFTDVPLWAEPYVDYCVWGELMAGMGGNKFAPNTAVTPAMAATVLLRYIGVPGENDTWKYSTSVDKAKEIGVTGFADVSKDVLLRGDMGIMIYNAVEIAETYDPRPVPKNGIEYGAWNGNTFTNKWSGIKFALPDNFTREYIPGELDMGEGYYADAVLYRSGNTASVMLAYLDDTDNQAGAITAKQLLDMTAEILVKEFEEIGENLGDGAKIKSELKNRGQREIGGATYEAVGIAVYVSDGSGEAVMTVRVYLAMRKIGNAFAVFTCSFNDAESEADINALLNSITRP
jgi:hypothetical protein